MEKLPLIRPLPDERQVPVLAGATGLFWLAQAVSCYLTVYLLGGVLFDGLGAHPYYRLVGGMYLCSVLVFLLSSLEHRTAPRPLPASGPKAS